MNRHLALYEWVGGAPALTTGPRISSGSSWTWSRPRGSLQRALRQRTRAAAAQAAGAASTWRATAPRSRASRATWPPTRSSGTDLPMSKLWNDTSDIGRWKPEVRPTRTTSTTSSAKRHLAAELRRKASAWCSGQRRSRLCADAAIKAAGLAKCAAIGHPRAGASSSGHCEARHAKPGVPRLPVRVTRQRGGRPALGHRHSASRGRPLSMPESCRRFVRRANGSRPCAPSTWSISLRRDPNSGAPPPCGRSPLIPPTYSQPVSKGLKLLLRAWSVSTPRWRDRRTTSPARRLHPALRVHLRAGLESDSAAGTSRRPRVRLPS